MISSEYYLNLVLWKGVETSSIDDMTTDRQERDDDIISFQKWVAPDVKKSTGRFKKSVKIQGIHYNRKMSRENPVFRYYFSHHIVVTLVTHTK